MVDLVKGFSAPYNDRIDIYIFERVYSHLEVKSGLFIKLNCYPWVCWALTLCACLCLILPFAPTQACMCPSHQLMSFVPIQTHCWYIHSLKCKHLSLPGFRSHPETITICLHTGNLYLDLQPISDQFRICRIILSLLTKLLFCNLMRASITEI